MERDYKNNNIFYENTEDLNIGKTNQGQQDLTQTQEPPRFSIKLDKDEEAARSKGVLDFNSGVQKVDTSEYSPRDLKDILGKSNSGDNTWQTENSTQVGEPTFDDVQGDSFSQYSTSDDVPSSMELYRNVLGRTAYENLKYACGLDINDSYTDYYNKTKYIPKGYEMEARLLLAEEKRMKLYAEYEAGNMSETDFLYHAYGKDLMKESGIDLSSPLYWYNKAKKNDFTNPLDSDTFLSDLIANAKTLWQAETWFKDSATRDLSSSLAGIVVGTQLSSEKVYEIFKNQFDALSPYFNDDYKKVLTYYQAGTLGSAFNPFIDIDSDGKPDYYYHTNGKLYAVKGSSGTGTATCEVKYDDEGKLHSVEINEGIEGGFGGFFEGLGAFLQTFADLGGMIWSATFGSIGKSEYFTESYQEYKAGMQRTFSNDDIQLFNGNHEWGYEIARGVGNVTGQIILNIALALLTYGAGNAGYLGAEAAQQAATTTAAQVVARAAVQSVGYAVAGAAVGAGVGAGVAAVTGQENIGEAALTGAGVGGVLGAGIGFSGALSSSDDVARASTNLASAVKTGTIMDKAGNAIKAQASIFQKGMYYTTKFVGFVTKSNSGAVFSGVSKFGRVGNAAILAVKDFANVASNLSATNHILSYYEKEQPELGIHPLSQGEIFGRAALAAAVDILISSTMRLQDDTGLTSTAKKAKLDLGGTLTYSGTLGGTTVQDVAITKKIFYSLSNSNRSLILNFSKSMPAQLARASVDNVFDIVENLLTMATTAAVSNPYAKLGSGESWKTFAESMVTPQAIIQNLYIATRNAQDYIGNTSTFRQRQQSILLEKVPAVMAKADTVLETLIAKTDDLALRDAFINLSRDFHEKAGITDDFRPSAQTDTTLTKDADSYYDKAITAIRALDEAFDKTIIGNLDKDKRELITEALGITDKKFAELSNAIIEGKNVEGLFTAVLLDEAKAENAKMILNLMQFHLNNVHEYCKTHNNTYKNAFFGGFNKVFSYVKNYFKSDWNNFVNYANKSLTDAKVRAVISNMNLESAFPTQKIQALTNTLTSVKRERLEECFNFEINDAINLAAAGTKRVTLDKDTNTPNIEWDVDSDAYKATDKTKITAAENVLVNVLTNKEMFDKLVSLKAFSFNEDGSIQIGQTPWLIISAKPEKLNDIKARENIDLSNYLYALETLADLSTKTNEAGEYLINADTPLCIKVDINTANGSNGVTPRAYYIIPTSEAMNNADILARFEMANHLISALYTIRTTSVTQLQINNALEILGLATQPNFVNGEDLLLGKKSIDDLLSTDREKLKRLGIATLLASSNIEAEDSTKSTLGFSRALILKMCSWDGHTGVIHPEDLDAIIKDYEANIKNGNSAYNKQTYDNAVKLKTYLETLPKIDDAVNALKKYTKRASEGLVKWRASETEAVRQLVEDLSKTENLWLKQALLADGNLPYPVLVAILNDKDLMLPFLNGPENIASPLVPSDLEANYSDVQKNAAINFFNKRLEAYVTRYKEVGVELTRPVTDIFREYLYSKRTASREDLKLSLQDFSAVKNDVNLFEAIASSIEKNLVIYKDRKQTESGKLQPFTNIISSDIYIELKKYIDEARRNNTRNIPELMSKLYDLWDASGDEAALKTYLAEREEFVEKHKDDIANFKKHVQECLTAESQVLAEETNILGIRNLARAFLQDNSLVADSSALKSVIKFYKDVVDEYNNYSAPITAIYSLHSAIIEAFEVFQTSPKYNTYVTSKDSIDKSRTMLGSYSYLLTLDNDSLARFLANPLSFLALEKKTAKALSVAYDSRIDAILADLKAGNYSREKIWLNMLSTISDNPITDVNELYNILSSDQPSKLKDYVMYALSIFENSEDPSIPNYTLLHRKNMKSIHYKGKDIFDILADNKNRIVKLLANEDTTVAERLVKDAQRYHEYIYSDTSLIDNPNVIEVNPLDLIPANYAKLLRLLSQSVDFSLNTASDALAKKDVLNQMQQILRNSGYGNLFDSQIATYLEEVSRLINSGAPLSPYIIDLNDAQAVNDFKRTLALLGYTDSDFLKIQNREPFQIPGVLYKNVQTRGIKTSLDAQKVYSYISSSIKLAYIKESKDIKKDFNRLLDSMFFSSYSFTNDTPVNLTDDEGKYTKLYGYFNLFNKDLRPGRSSSFAENLIKSGLIGGDFSKVRTIINEGVTFDPTDIDEVSKNTFNVLNVISAVEDFYNKDMAAKAYTFEIAVNSEEAAKNIINQAKAELGNDTLFRLASETPLQVNGTYKINFVYNEDFDFNAFRNSLTSEFTISKLIPLFYSNENMNLSQHTSNMDILNYIYQRGIEGFTSLEELINNVVTPIKIYSLDETEYNSFVDLLSNGKTTIGEIKQALKIFDTNNYYIKALENYIKTGEAVNNFFANAKTSTYNTLHPEQEVDFSLLNNYFIRKVVGSVLNKEDYSELLSLRDTNADDYRKKLEAAVAEIIDGCNNESLEESIKDSFTTNLKHFDSYITSGSLSKLKLSNANEAKNLDSDLLYYTLDELIHQINFKDAMVYYPESLDDMPIHNKRAAILSVLDAVDDKIYINLDYLLTLNNEDKMEIKQALLELKNNATEIFGESANQAIAEIDRVLNVYERKLDILKQMSAIKDYDALAVAIRHEPAFANQPTNEIIDHVIGKGTLAPEELSKLATLSQNAFLAKNPYSKFIASSSLKEYDSDKDYSPFTKMYMDDINSVLLPSIDKQGSATVYNMDALEARSAYVDTLVSFATLLKDFKINGKVLFDFKGIDETKTLETLMTIGHYANLYSTGTTYDAEFTGALVVSWKEDTSDIKINPIIVSSSDVDRSILGSLFVGDKLLTKVYEEKGTKHVLIQLDKNSFKQSISGINSTIKFYDLDDVTTQQRLVQKAIYKARAGLYSDDSFAKDMTNAEVLQKYYGDYVSNHATYFDRVNHLTSILTEVVGIPKSVALKTIQSIQTLNVANETNWSEQRLHTIIKDALTPLEPFVNNKQLEVLRDVFIHGITKNALSNEALAKIENVARLFEDSIENENVLLAADELPSILQGTGSKELLDSLTSKEKVQALKLFILRRKTGSDLEYILSGDDAVNVHNDILNKVKASEDDSYVRSYDEVTGTFSYVKWADTARHGKPTTIGGKTVYNALSTGNWVAFDSEWLIGLSNRLYQIGFIVGDAVHDTFTSKDELFTKAKAQKYVILISKNLVDNAEQASGKTDNTKYYHIESADSFKTKKDLALENLPIKTLNGVTCKEVFDTKTNVTTYIVNEETDAFKLMNGLTQNCDTILGYNNTSKGSDDSWLEQYEDGRAILDRADNIDIRLHVVNSTETSDENLKLQSKDSLQHYKDTGIISSENAHDALSDVEDSLELYIHTINNRQDVTKVYDEEWSKFKDLGFTDEELSKALTFKNINPEEYKLIDDAYFNSKYFKKSNSMVKLLVDAYNIQGEYAYTRARTKELHQKVRELILGDTLHRQEYRDTWYRSVKNFSQHSAITNIVYNLMFRANGNQALDNLTSDTLRNLYFSKDANNREIDYSSSALNVLDRAIKEYKDVLTKNSDSDDYINNDKASKTFFSLPVDEMLSYINKAIGLSRDDRSLLAESPAKFFTSQTSNGFIPLEVLSSDEVVNLSDAAVNYTTNTLVSTILKPLYDNVLSSEEAKKAPAFFSALVNNMVKMIGDYDYSDKNYRETRKKDLLVFASSLDNDLKDFLLKAFSMEDGFYYQSKSLYVMGSEKGEFSDKILRDKGEYGVIYVGEDLLYRAYPYLKNSSLIKEENGERYLYTNSLRQPGEGKTTHLLKLVIESGNGLQMTRATAQSYFDGDEDGDFYFICAPDETMQEVGSSLYKYLTYGSSLLDLFDDIQIKKDVTVDTSAISEKLRAQFKDAFNDLFELAESNSPSLYTKYQKVKNDVRDVINSYSGLPEDAFETFWGTYAPQLNRMIDANGNVGYYLFCTDSSYFENASDKIKELIRKGDRIHTYSNMFYNNYDSQVVGGISKNLLHRNYADVNSDGSDIDIKTLTPNDILYNADIALNEKSLNHLQSIIASTDNATVVNRLTTYIDSLDSSLFSNEVKSSIKSLITSIPTIKATDIVGIAQLVQKYVQYTDVYNSTLKTAITTNLNTYTQQYKDKLLLLEEYCKNQPFTFGYQEPDEDINNMSGPKVLQRVAYLLDKIKKYASINQVYMSTFKNSTFRNLFARLVTDGDLDIKHSRDIDVIAPNGTSSFETKYKDNTSQVDYNQIGLTPMKIMILDDKVGEDTARTDTAISTKYNKINDFQVFTLDYSEKQKSLDALTPLNGKTLSGFELNKLTNSRDFNNNYKYTVVTGDRGLISFAVQHSFNSLVSGGFVKIGNAFGKGLKATMSPAIDKTDIQGIQPDIILSQSLFEKLSSQVKIKELGTAQYGSNGNTYKVYEINDMTLLNSWADNSLSNGVKASDKISILHGLNEVTAFINMGTMALEVDGDTIKFNPEGINEMNAALNSFRVPELSEVNAADEINMTQIASILLTLDPKDVEDFIAEIPGISSLKLDDVLIELYSKKDIGGKYGDSIITALTNKLARMENSEEIKDKIFSNPLYKAAWQSDVQDSRENFMLTSADTGSEEYLRGKRENSKVNRRYSDMTYTNKADARYIASSNSAIDCTSFYYGRVQYLQNLLSNLSGKPVHISKGFLNSLYENGLIDKERLIRGSQPNKFKPILDRNATKVDSSKFYEGNPIFKYGGLSEVSTAASNNFKYRGYDVIENDSGSLERTNTDYIKKYLNEDGSYIPKATLSQNSHTSLMPFLTTLGENSDINILQAMNNNKYVAEGTLDRPVLTLKNDSLEVGNYHKTLNPEPLQRYVETQKKFIGSTKLAAFTAEKLRSAEYKINSSGETLSAITEISDFLSSNSYVLDETVGKILASFSNNDLENEMTFKPMSDFLRAQLTAENISRAINLSRLDNGIDLYDSATRSWGFFAKGGKDISLGQRIIYLNNQVKQYQQKLLGDEYASLIYIFNKDTTLANIIDKYIDADYKLEIYEKLTGKNKDIMIRNLGEEKYNEYLSETEKLIIGSSNVGIEEAVNTLKLELSNIKNNPNMFALLNDDETKGKLGIIATINKRLLEEAQKTNPYALLGYYMPIYKDSNSKKKSMIPSYIAAWNIKTEATKDILNGYSTDNRGNVHIASRLYDTDEGYLGMISRIAQNYAVTNTMREFNKFLQSSGYMRNIEVFSAAQEIIFKTMQKEFKDSFTHITKDEVRYEYDRDTYNILRNNVETYTKESLDSKYLGPESFVKLYEAIAKSRADAFAKYNISSREGLETLLVQADVPGSEYQINKQTLRYISDLDDIYQNTVAVMINILEENSSRTADSFLVSLYNQVLKKLTDTGVLTDDTVLVDSRGATLNNDGKYPVILPLNIDDIIKEVRLNSSSNRQAEIAKMMLTGDIYVMRKSVSDQLMKKVYTQYQPGIIGRTLNKVRNYVTGYIMATPTNLVDRMANFTIFDFGTLASADIAAVKNLFPAISTVEKYVMHPEYVTEETINTDKNLQYLLRYMAATGQTPVNNTVYQGDDFSISNIPLIREYMKMASTALSKQQFYVRLAYFMDLVEDGEKRDFNLNPTKFGVAFHLKKGLSNMDAGNKDAYIYNVLFNPKEGRYYSQETDGDYLAKMRNMDAAAVQVVAENVGIFGNMPYGSKWLSSRLGMMFTGFPMAAIRWGSNRLQSLAYAFTTINQAESRHYLFRNLGSTALTYTILLALQVLFSQDTRDYLEEKLKGKKDEEIDEDKVANAKNILFRGGCVKLFDSWMKQQEVTSAGQSRDMVAHLWENYVADFILNNKETGLKNFWNIFKKATWGHQNSLIKDTVESIPGNTYLQTYNWFEPSDNFLENVSRKALGYFLGNAQANGFMDSMKASAYEDDQAFLEKLGTGMRHAFIDDTSGIKEYKSDYRNYKKAFSIVYKYLTSTSNYTDEYTDSSSKNFKDIKSELTNALKEKSSASAFYNIIQKYLKEGTALKTVKSAVASCSLRTKLLKLQDINSLKDIMTDSELSVIKSALAYEDYMFPYLTTYVEDLEEEYQRQKAKSSNSSSYVRSIASILNSMSYNTPTYYRNTNYNNYIRHTNYYNQINQPKYMARTPQYDPLQEYTSMRNAADYGTSKDIWGTETQHYKDGTSYVKRARGYNPFEEGGNK